MMKSIIMMMFISSVILDISPDEMRERYRETFKEYDANNDGFITKEDIENFLTNPEYQGVLSERDREEIRESMTEAIDKNGGRLSEEAYISLMEEAEKENPSDYAQFVRDMFPGKEIVTRDELCSKVPNLDRKNLKESYTIKQIVELVYGN